MITRFPCLKIVALNFSFAKRVMILLIEDLLNCHYDFCFRDAHAQPKL